MKLLDILQIVAAALTILTGLIAFIRPRAVQGFTGLRADGARGISEIRGVLGGLFIGLGAAPLILNTAEAYRTLGIGYLGVAVARAVSIVVDESTQSSNVLSLVIEIAFGIVLVL